MRIATWNLDRPLIRRVNRGAQRMAELQKHAADIWILTETDRELRLPEHAMVASEPLDERGYSPREALATVHSRWPIKKVACDAIDPAFAVIAEIACPPCPLVVCGSIITYRDDGVKERRARPWELHRRSARLHGDEWTRLRREFPKHVLVVGGDFNQALDGVGRYRDDDATLIMRDAFARAELRCVTDEDFVATRKLKTRHSIDHLAITCGILHKCSVDVRVWEGTTAQGVELSDHNGVSVTFAFPEGAK